MNQHQVIQPSGFFPTFQELCKNKNKEELVCFNQYDAEVFLQFVLEHIHDGMKITLPSSRFKIKGEIKTAVDKLMKDYCKYYEVHLDKNGISPITQEYEGIHCSSITNDVDSKSSNSFEPFLYINLSISELNEHDSIIKSLNMYTSPEVLSGYKDDEKQYPPDTTFRKQITFVNLPNNFIIVLKRFKFDMQTMNSAKVRTVVGFPTKLDMGPYCVGYVNKIKTYELYGICNHQGGLNGGHYYSFVKEFDGNWILYNDRTFKNVASETMEKEKLFSKDAYMLFYRKTSE